MTAKKAIENFQKLIDYFSTDTLIDGSTIVSSCAKAMEVLKKEAEVEESIEWFREALDSGYFNDRQFGDELEELDFVQTHNKIPIMLESARPKGSWIYVQYSENGENPIGDKCGWYKCSNCGYERYCDGDTPNYCEDCGAEMN